MANKQKMRKRRRALLCVFAAFAFSFNALGKVTYATPKYDTKVVNYVQNQEETSNSIQNQPISSYWYPEDLLKWSASTDKDVNFNKSTVPLAKRVEKEKLDTINETQNKDVKVVAISIMNANTSGNPSQGSNKFSANTFSYWQYIDKLVYWGGSAGEGLIVPPSPDVTDSAHRNGVPVLGTVFFPMTAHGGKMEWLDQFLQKDSNGNFPIVDKLIEVANTYGFDGWFINQETEGTAEEPLTPEHAQLMQELIKQFKAKSNGKLEIMWYDSMTKDGEMDWQNALTDKNEYFLLDGDKNKVADSMFLNFWWTYNSLKDKDLLRVSNEKAKETGINPYDLYAGIDVQANGYKTPLRWTHYQRDNQAPFTSLGLYCPSWTYFDAKTPEEFQYNESRLWVNENGDPSKGTNAQNLDWRGISTYSVEKSAVTTLPFTTNFNMGNGYDFYVNGAKVSTQDWNNRSLNDIMPTYRWVISNEENNNVKADIDYTTAYYGGNSIKLSGYLAEGKSSTIKLYSADLALPEGVQFTTTAKANGNTVDMDLVLTFHDGEEATIAADKKLGTDWTKLTYDVSPYVGKSIKTISYKLSSPVCVENFSANLGNITIETLNSSSIVNVSNTNLNDVDFKDGIYAGVRLSWTPEGNASDVHHYEVYRVMGDGTKVLLGATPNTSYYVSDLRRNDKESNTTFEVVAVNKNYNRGNGQTVNMEWPAYPTPTASFKVSNTLIAPGQPVTFTNTSSEVTEEIEWKFPGATVKTSTEQNPTVTYEKEGVYPVILTAKNSSGENVETKTELITVTNAAKDGLVNLSLNKPATASSFVNENEAPKFALDGDVKTKWCAVGSAPHTLTIDLGDVKTIGELEISHAEAGGESSGMNTRTYSLEVSNDGENFTPVLNVNDNTKAISNDAFPVTKARYVRLNIIQPTQGADSAARIYEVAVKGLDGDVELPPAINPDEPDKPVDPDQPVDPDKPVDPEKPVDPDQPVNPDKPENPDQPVDPEKPVNPDQPEKPGTPDEKPALPVNLNGKEVTHNSALLGWDAPENSDQIQEYVVYQDGKEIGRVPADKTPLEFLAKDLNPNTKYKFEVSSIDKNGKESDKIGIEVTTNKKDGGNLPNTGAPIGTGALATAGIAISAAGAYLTLKKKKK
ncbi:discoidin domain-containing protein [Clostridium perfringens]|nr:discoidin domain-containing protein [Clostridium perfringens]